MYEKTINRLCDIVETIYSYNGVGANCHIVLDDGNIEDGHIHFCIDQIKEGNHHSSTPEQLEIELECMELMLSLPVSERASLPFIPE